MRNYNKHLNRLGIYLCGLWNKCVKESSSNSSPHSSRTHYSKVKLPVGSPWTVDSWTPVPVWTQWVAAHNNSHSTSFVAVKQTDQSESAHSLSQQKAARGRTAWGVEWQPGTANLMPWNMCCQGSSGHTPQDMLLNLWHRSHIMPKGALANAMCLHMKL